MSRDWPVTATTSSVTGVKLDLAVPEAIELPAVAKVLAGWQYDGLPVQLHPGDLGWAWQVGAQVLAARLRTWSRKGRIVSLGLLDGPRLIRMAIDPNSADDNLLASQMLADIEDPTRGVLPEGTVAVEARFGPAFRSRLVSEGWTAGEPWRPLSRDLTTPVPDCGVRVEVVGPGLANARAALQNASFGSSRFTEEHWLTASRGPLFADARDLLAYDEQDRPVAMATVWSAGVGRPGVLEPMGVHPDHRGHGYGRAITVAAAAALRGLGASTATVCAESSNVGAVQTYASAGFQVLPEVTDFRRAR